MAQALVICGPTSVGKSAIALAVASQLGAEIVNADSRQIYRGMDVGTGMPTAGDLALVPHHLYGFLDPAHRYSAARYVHDAGEAIHGIWSRGRLPIVVGGTGFYIEALTGSMPLDRPPGEDALRARLRFEANVHPPGVLWEWLLAIAPERAAETRAGDSYRIMRALEAELAGRGERVVRAPVSDVGGTVRGEVVVLRLARERLRARIASRVQAMFAQGLVAEAEAVRAAAGDAPALSGLGYAEALTLLDGLATEAEALASTIRRTRSYAKRQETWFRRMHRALALDAGDADGAIRAIVALARERLVPA